MESSDRRLGQPLGELVSNVAPCSLTSDWSSFIFAHEPHHISSLKPVGSNFETIV
jgi:hypothetical protein